MPGRSRIKLLALTVDYATLLLADLGAEVKKLKRRASAIQVLAPSIGQEKLHLDMKTRQGEESLSELG